MGNRAVITTEENFEKNSGLGVYLHWNGGRDSVQGFLEYCRLRSFRRPESDDYGWARLCQVAAIECDFSLSPMDRKRTIDDRMKLYPGFDGISEWLYKHGMKA